MEESTAESTAATVDTLKRELKKLLTEILSNGESDGSPGVLKAIDEAIRLLNRLKEVESKNPESPKVDVPKEFKCILSNEIMIEPVVIASGNTFEKIYITEYLRHENKCPKSNQLLSHSLCTPNHLLDELITNWCLANGYDRPKPPLEVVTELSNDGIESLLQRISSPSSDEDQVQAAKEIRCQTNKFPNVRDRFVALHPQGITMLIRPLSDLVSSKPELQENLITALLNISTVKENVEAISQTDKVVSVLTTSLTSGTMETQRNSASALLSLLAIPSNKELIGSEVTFTALGVVIVDGDTVTSLIAGSVVFRLCQELEYTEKAISAGMVHALMTKIRAGRYEPQLLGVLALLTTQERAVMEMEKNRQFMRHLLGILRTRSCLGSCEYAVVIVLNMCNLATPRDTLQVVNLEENEYATFTNLTKHGSSETLVNNARMVLQWLKVHGTGKKRKL